MVQLIDKYKPRTLDEIVGNRDIITKLKQMVETKLQNIIITGSSGLGKSSCIFSIIEALNADSLELNASDERNISVIRSTIKTFVMKKSFRPKIIILEEIDNMPKGSQYGIASLIDNNVNTSFILTCNDYDKIIENLTSKCMILKFKCIEEKEIVKRLMNICDSEHIICNVDILGIIAKRSMGDLRKAINILQTLYYYYKEPTISTLNMCSTEPPSMLIQNILHKCITSNIPDAFDILDILLNDGYDCSDLIFFLFLEGMYMNIDDKYLYTIGETQCIMINDTSKMHLYSLIIKLSQIST